MAQSIFEFGCACEKTDKRLWRVLKGCCQISFKRMLFAFADRMEGRAFWSALCHTPRKGLLRLEAQKVPNPDCQHILQVPIAYIQ